jgi:hypothetical protein
MKHPFSDVKHNQWKAIGILPVAFSILVFAPCSLAQKAGGKNAKPSDWNVLFDGRSTSAWRGFRSPDFPSACWVIEDGALKRRVAPDLKKEDCGDIITRDQYDNFELEFEWRSATGGNSGVKYLIPEDRPASWERVYMDIEREDFKKAGLTYKPDPKKWAKFPIGFEFQLIDDERNPDARKSPKRVTGSLYDMLAPSQRPVRPAGEYNHGRILVQGNHVEHWINGVKVLEFELGSQALKDAIAQSKFKPMEGFGSVRRGHIDLQDHDSEVWFKNIRIRKLTAR